VLRIKTAQLFIVAHKTCHRGLSLSHTHTPKNCFSKRQRAHYIKFTGSFTTRRQAHFFPSNLYPKSKTFFFFFFFKVPVLFSVEKLPHILSALEVWVAHTCWRERSSLNKVRISDIICLTPFSIGKYLHNGQQLRKSSFLFAGVGYFSFNYWKSKLFFIRLKLKGRPPNKQQARYTLANNFPFNLIDLMFGSRTFSRSFPIRSFFISVGISGFLY
jgi:hypothetical protein